MKNFVFLGETILEILAARGGKEDLSLARLKSAWKNIVGEKNHTHCKPDSLIGKKLVVIANNPVWVHHLKFFELEIINKINEFFGETVVQGIVFRFGTVDRKIYSKKVNIPAGKKLSTYDKDMIEEITCNINDSEIKNALTKLFTKQALSDK